MALTCVWMCDAWSQAAIKRPVSSVCQNAGSECQCGRASVHNVAESQFYPFVLPIHFTHLGEGVSKLLLGWRYGVLATGLARLEPPNNGFFSDSNKKLPWEISQNPLQTFRKKEDKCCSCKKMESSFVSVLDFRIDFVCLRPNPFYILPRQAHFKCPLVRE